MTSPEKNALQHSATVKVSRSSHRIPISMLLIGAALLAFNHYYFIHGHRAILGILLLAPMMCILGTGGLWEPRLAWTLGPLGRTFPPRLKIISGVLVAAGMALSAYLALGVYHLQTIEDHYFDGPNVSRPAR